MTVLCVVAGDKHACTCDLVSASPHRIITHTGEFQFPGDIVVRHVSSLEHMRALRFQYAVDLGHGSFDGYQQEVAVRGARFVYGLKQAGIGLVPAAIELLRERCRKSIRTDEDYNLNLLMNDTKAVLFELEKKGYRVTVPALTLAFAFLEQEHQGIDIPPYHQ
jgi:hypothetical protein